MTSVRVLHGDCLTLLPTLESASVDSIVTDPPYELGFMGKQWDASGIAYNVTLWAECLRVLKPGGHLLAFGGTRTYHRMAVAIEDAGFEIRDSIHWLYGSGFPKSLDVSKAIDKRGGNAHLTKQIGAALKAARQSRNIGITEADRRYCGGVTLWSWYEGRPAGQQMPTAVVMRAIAADWPEMQPYADLIDEAEREVIGVGEWGVATAFGNGRWATHEERAASTSNIYDITAPATDAAKQWSGWGTALKPAHEPIVVARKPLAGTVAACVLEHGTGALNIDGCRVGGGWLSPQGAFKTGHEVESINAGRWPANLVLTHAADCADTCAPSCPVAEVDQQSGISGTTTRKVGKVTGTTFGSNTPMPDDLTDVLSYGDLGGASRFFTLADYDPIADAVPFAYIAKPSRAERDAGLDGLPLRFAPTMNDGIGAVPHNAERASPKANTHPTVKPVELMRWLVRLVTPPDGTVLDPFAGSGTTLVAARLEGFAAVGIEMTAEYLPIIEGRIAWAERVGRSWSPERKPEPTPDQLSLFDEVDL